MRQTALLLLLFTSGLIFAQTKAITIEDVWQNYTFMPDRVSGFNFLKDGRSFTRLEENAVVKYDLKTGNRTNVLAQGAELPNDTGFDGRIDEYQFSTDESKLMLSNQSEQLFRRSSQSYFFVYDLVTETLTPVYPDKKHRLATLDPTGKRVAFVVDNNVWIKELASGKMTQVTSDGETNKIINGASDWVYKFDESKVKEFTYTDFHNGMYPEYNTFKYPKVGEENSTVSLHAFNVNSGKTKDLLSVNTSPEDEWHYLPRVQWTTEGGRLTAQRMNRHQSKLELLLFDLASER